MTFNTDCRQLDKNQIDILESQGCSAEDWQDVVVGQGFNTDNVKGVHFAGRVEIAAQSETVKDVQGVEKPCGVYNATIINCRIAKQVRIANVGVHIANYDICENVCIEDVGTLQTNADAAFGNGVEVEVLNEAGGREVTLFNELSAQFAYMQCLHRYRPKLIEKLNGIAQAYAASVKSDRGTIGEGAKISSAGEIIDVRIGPSAKIKGASRLVNGSILSSEEAPTVIGENVTAEDFIIAEGSSVNGGAILSKTFIGQGCQIGKQFSAENCLFFANCEGFHGEACAVFAGPYTVTHHKSTLLIAGLFSFYNAGSGTNQSNHMYKLGPVHEGKLLRGTKTGSFSYMMWPCNIGPFSVVLGKHKGTLDTADFPFSHLDARADGKCMIVPGLNLTTVGTVRDGAKWPSRDKRKGKKRDIINFDVFSPYTIGKMFKASAILKELQEKTDKSIEEVALGGAIIKRLILRMSRKYYRTGIEMYLLEKVAERIEQYLQTDTKDYKAALAADKKASDSGEWVDIAGQMMAKSRLVEVQNAIEKNSVSDIDGFLTAMNKINEYYSEDEWAWVVDAYEQVFAVDITVASKENLIDAVRKLLATKGKFLKLVLVDAEKEFDEISWCGFGQDGDEKDRQEDFSEVRGRYEENKFVKQMQEAIDTLNHRCETIIKKLSSL